MKGFSMSKKKQGGDIVHGDGLQMAERTATRQEQLLLVFKVIDNRSVQTSTEQEILNNTNTINEP